MNFSITNNTLSKTLLLTISLFIASVCFAERGAGGFQGGVGYHQSGGYHQGNGYHQDGYHQGNGYHQYNNYNGYHNNGGYNNAVVAPVVLTPGFDDNVDCQTVQQCDEDDNCIDTQECN